MKLYTGKIEEKNFHNAYAKAIQVVLREGVDLVIGGVEQRKPIKDSCMLISLIDNAIKQVENREIHPQFPTKKKHLDIYCKEYTRDFLREYEEWDINKKFSYLYFERLVSCIAYSTYVTKHRRIDQIMLLKQSLAEQVESVITSNRQQAITWIVDKDINSLSPPCLQRIQIRYVPENKVDVHLTWRCYDRETEVLTNHGWKYFKDLDYSDDVATLEESTNKLIYQKPNKLFEYDYTDEMIHFKGKKVDLLVTPNHQMYVRSYEQKNYCFREAQDCPGTNLLIKKDCSWDGIDSDFFVLPSQELTYKTSNQWKNITGERTVKWDEKKFNMETFLKFLGWYISEGNIHQNKRERKYLIQISNTNEEYKTEIKQMIIDLGYECSISSNKVTFSIYNKQLCSFLKQFGVRSWMKKTPDFIKKLPPEKIRLYLETLFKGDGHNLYPNFTSGKGEYTTTSKMLADDVQELLLKLGIQSTLSIGKIHGKNKRISYRVRPSIYKESWIKRVEKHHYNGKVYCCEVPNHIIMVRRNGKIHWNGNSRDLFSAWQSNVICLIDMLNREVVKPNNCEIVRIIDFSDSLHIYKTDLEEAKKVKLVPTNPQEIF